MNHVWILTTDVRYETHNEFIAVWKGRKPNIHVLIRMLPSLTWEQAKQLKIICHTTDNTGADFTLTRQKLGVKFNANSYYETTTT